MEAENSLLCRQVLVALRKYPVYVDFIGRPEKRWYFRWYL